MSESNEILKRVDSDNIWLRVSGGERQGVQVEGSTRLHAVVGDPTRGNDRGDRAATEEAVACA